MLTLHKTQMIRKLLTFHLNIGLWYLTTLYNPRFLVRKRSFTNTIYKTSQQQNIPNKSSVYKSKDKLLVTVTKLQ